ncbi:hypothetical protein [Paenibacillus graminis]|uniref:hypothetical protein n=1 Tax=Paenibacillus graminis TaxID=189425 RepID=UPI002DBCAADB|nr:hypothetical protein [Paenibacillus graminis]MEC0167383.1 hypothetical protein [Paenibacillus graminis]
MKRMYSLIVLPVILCLLLVGFAMPAHAHAAAKGQTSMLSAVATPAPTAGNSDDSGKSWIIPDFIYDLMDKVNEMIQSFKDLMSGKLIKDAIEGLTIMLVDDALAPLYGAFEQSYLFTPQIAEIDVVYMGWSYFMIAGLALLFIGILWLVFRIIHGKQPMGALIKVFLACFAATYLSLTLLNFANVGVNWMAQNSFEGIIGTSGISFQGLEGQQILKALIVGKDGITEASYAAMTLGELTSQTSGGIFTLLGYVLLVVFPLYLVAIFKVLILILMAIFVPMWIAYAAFTGKMETLLGYGNLYLRTILVGLICGLHWAIFVKMQTNYGEGKGFCAAIGIPPVIFAMITTVMLIIFFYFFWLKPMFRAAKSPITLNGSQVLDTLGGWGERSSAAMDNIGKRMGSEGMQKRALSMKESSKRMRESAERMKDKRSVAVNRMASGLTKGMSEAWQGVTYEAPTEWLTTSGTVDAAVMSELELGEPEIIASGMQVYSTLKDEGFSSVSLVEVSPDQRKKLSGQLKSLKPEYQKEVKWNEATGELLLTGETMDLVQQLESLGYSLPAGQEGMYRDGAFVDLASQQIKTVHPSERTEKAIQAVHDSLPMFTKLPLAEAQATAAYHALQQREDEWSWAKRIRMEQGVLWVPEEAAEEAAEVLEEMLVTMNKKVRCNFPRHSQFADDMLESWRREGQHTSLLSVLELSKDQSHVYVPEDQLKEFSAAYDDYRQERTPYWTAKDSTVYVIRDGVPVSYGQPPLSGLDMGSFEKLQQDMLYAKQAAKRKAG